MKNAVRVVSDLSDGQAFAAQGAIADGGVRISFDFDDLAVFDLSDYPTTAMAASTYGSDLFDFLHIPLLVLFFFCWDFLKQPPLYFFPLRLKSHPLKNTMISGEKSTFKISIDLLSMDLIAVGPIL
jgi:hypothetical protein